MYVCDICKEGSCKDCILANPCLECPANPCLGCHDYDRTKDDCKLKVVARQPRQPKRIKTR